MTRELQGDSAKNKSDIVPERCILMQMMSDFEKFPPDELKTLRDELRQSGLDSFQSAELLAAFLNQHGYGVSSDQARHAAARIEQQRYALPRMQEELEKLAWVM
jgi:hypothetical protein